MNINEQDLPRMSYGDALREVVRLSSENHAFRQALQLIENTDPFYEALDPEWAVRVARVALREAE